MICTNIAVTLATSKHLFRTLRKTFVRLIGLLFNCGTWNPNKIQLSLIHFTPFLPQHALFITLSSCNIFVALIYRIVAVALAKFKGCQKYVIARSGTIF